MYHEITIGNFYKFKKKSKDLQKAVGDENFYFLIDQLFPHPKISNLYFADTIFFLENKTIDNYKNKLFDPYLFGVGWIYKNENEYVFFTNCQDDEFWKMDSIEQFNKNPKSNCSNIEIIAQVKTYKTWVSENLIKPRGAFLFGMDLEVARIFEKINKLYEIAISLNELNNESNSLNIGFIESIFTSRRQEEVLIYSKKKEKLFFEFSKLVNEAERYNKDAFSIENIDRELKKLSSKILFLDLDIFDSHSYGKKTVFNQYNKFNKIIFNSLSEVPIENDLYNDDYYAYWEKVFKIYDFGGEYKLIIFNPFHGCSIPVRIISNIKRDTY